MAKLAKSSDIIAAAKLLADIEINAWRKILSFASSAGETIAPADALHIIRLIARERLGLPAPSAPVDEINGKTAATVLA